MTGKQNSPMILAKAMSHVNQDRQAARSRQNAGPDLGLSKEESNSGSPPRLTGDPTIDVALWRLSLLLRQLAETEGTEEGDTPSQERSDR
jgi:hypothetical protein